MKLLLGGAREGRDRTTSLLLNKSKPEENCPQDISNCNLFQSQLKGLRKWKVKEMHNSDIDMFKNNVADSKKN